MITLADVPTTIALLEPLPELPVEEGDEPAAVWLGEDPVAADEEVNGLESDESTAAVRSNSNWRMLVI